MRRRAAARRAAPAPGKAAGLPAPSQRPIVVDGERGVVREAARLVDRLALRGRGDAGGGDLVVDAPADVLRPSLATVGPPGVMPGLLVQLAEDVHESDFVEDVREPGALL